MNLQVMLSLYFGSLTIFLFWHQKDCASAPLSDKNFSIRNKIVRCTATAPKNVASI